jgi:tetrahedral aminopeptidase
MSVTSLHSEYIFAVLQELHAISGPTGQEEAVRQWLRTRWQSRMLEWHEDPVGNIFCRVGGQGSRLLVAAHMDEIGFVVRYITDDGFLFLDTAQNAYSYIEKRYMVGHVAQVIGRYGIVAEGVFAASSGHTLIQIQPSGTNAHPSGMNDFFVDIGVTSRAEAEACGVHIGAAVIWSSPLRQVGSRLIGKAMDDRMLIGIMDLLLDQLDPSQLTYELWFGATIQEENGVHGAQALSHHTHFDIAVALDVGLVGDIPTVGPKEYPNMLGRGPTLVHKDQTIHYDKRLLWHIADVATQHAIPFQHGVYRNYGSDAAAFINHGIPTLLIGVPTRYTHTPFEMVDEHDILSTIHLLHKLITTEAFAYVSF